jgi:ABC-type polysaccharide/polyol phosphate export permease
MSRILVDFAEIVHDLKRFRYLLYQLTLRDIRIRYKQAAMGFCWAVFMPALVVFAGMLVRFALAHVEHRAVAGGEAAALAVKAVPWAFFVGTLQFATTSLTGNTSLVTKVYFPREVLPLAATLGQGFDALIATASLVLVLPFLGVVPSGALLWVPVLSLLLLLLTAAAALCLSCANLFFRDVKYIVQVLLTFGIFFTPVFFEPALFGRLGGRIVMLNPIAPILEGFRLSVVEGHDLLQSIPGADGWIWHPGYLLYSAGWAVAGLLVSALFFHRMEILFAEYA